MAGRATLAGILALVSLVVPVEIVSYPRFFDLHWTAIVVRLFNGRTFLFNVTQFQPGDAVLYVFVLLTVLAGGILLLSLRARPRVGAILVIVGVTFYILDLIYDEVAFRSFGTPIPLGFFLMLSAAIIGLVAKPIKPLASPTSLQAESSTDRLVKLKSLFDSGAITKEEYEEQKRKLLETG